MSVSTDGQICFGVVCEEGYDFPWDGDRFDGDIQGWWRTAVCEYRPPFEIYDQKGNYIDGQKPPQEKIKAYRDAERQFDAAHPVPVTPVNHCSGECPMYIVAVPSSFRSCRRGYPVAFDPAELIVDDADREALLEFCRTHGIEHGEPGWWLSSFWG